MSDIKNLGGFVWSIAETLRGDFKQSEYGKVILPFVVLRRLDCILAASKDTVLDAAKTLPENADDATRDMILFGAVGGNVKVYNLSRFTFDTLKGHWLRILKGDRKAIFTAASAANKAAEYLLSLASSDIREAA